MISDVVIYSERKIQTAVANLAELTSRQLTIHPGDDSPIHVLVVMDGAFLFAADFIRYMNPALDIRVHFIKATSYTGTISAGHVTIGFVGPVPELKMARVLVLDDIMDTGDTILAIHRWLEERDVFSFQTVCLFRRLTVKSTGQVMRETLALLRHPEKAFVRQVQFGLDVEPGEFIVGYGLDFNGEFRHLPHVVRYESA